MLLIYRDRLIHAFGMLSSVSRFKTIAICMLAVLPVLSSLGQDTAFEGYPAVRLSNDKLDVLLMKKGSTVASITLRDDQEKLNPLWNPMRMAREAGRPPHFDGGAGLFVCVDGFGPVSDEEKAAGLPMHGEAHSQLFDVKTDRQSTSNSVTMSAKLPIVQEEFSRTFRLVNGESVVFVESELQNLLGFDRPVNWAEHATIGSPFLAPGETVVDLSGSRSQTRPYDQAAMVQSGRRLTSGQDFTWPLAPGLNGKTIDLRQTPEALHYLDHATTLLDPARDLEWTTALNMKEHLLLGYIFRRAEYPWLQYWGNYPSAQQFSRGMEFGSQPFDVPRRDAISMATMFGAPTYRWLPAHSRIASRFLIFFTRVPGSLAQVDDVRLEHHQIVVEDHTNHQEVRLATSFDLQR